MLDQNILNQTKYRLLVSGALLVGGAIAADPLKTIITGPIAGIVCGDMYTHLKHSCNSGEMLKNHDLTKAVGGAISLLIRDIVQSNLYPKYQKSLDKLAKTALKYWPEVAKATDGQNDPFFEIKESQIIAMFAKSATEFAKIRVLQPEEWLYVLDWLIKEAEVELPQDIINYLGKFLHENFPKSLRELIKDDAARGGKAFPGLLISLLGEVASTIRSMSNNSEAQYADILKRLDILAMQQHEPDKSKLNHVCAWLFQVESGLYDVLNDLKLSVGRIEAVVINMFGEMKELRSEVKELRSEVKELKPVKIEGKNHDPKSEKITFVLDGSLDGLEFGQLKKIERYLQQRGGDVNLTILKVDEGSIILTLEGSPEGVAKLQALFESGQLTKILGLPVERVTKNQLINFGEAMVNLTQWFQNLMEVGDQILDELLTPIAPRPNFAPRGSGNNDNSTIINSTIKLLQETIDNDKKRWEAIKTLGKIAVGNQTAISAVSQILEKSEDEEFCWQAALTLGKIDPNNPLAGVAKSMLINLPEADFNLIVIVGQRKIQDQKIAMRIQLASAQESSNPALSKLPIGIELALLDNDTGEIIEEVISESSENTYIQILPFEGDVGDKFDVRVKLGNIIITQNFTV